MEHKKQAVLQAVDARSEELFALGCDIFDHPELGRQEYYACDRLIAFLEQEGFSVQRGVGGLETAFRAIWEQGSGGPAIGFMMEYDALKGLGHGCGSPNATDARRPAPFISLSPQTGSRQDRELGVHQRGRPFFIKKTCRKPRHALSV